MEKEIREDMPKAGIWYKCQCDRCNYSTEGQSKCHYVLPTNEKKQRSYKGRVLEMSKAVIDSNNVDLLPTGSCWCEWDKETGHKFRELTADEVKWIKSIYVAKEA